MVVLPPYIRALVSPQLSPQAAGIPSAYSRTFAIPNGIEEATHTLEMPAHQGLLMSNCGNGPGNFRSGRISKSLDVFSCSVNLDSDKQSEANSELWKYLLENGSATFSPRRESLIPTESRHYPRAEGPSPLTQQLTSVSSNVPAAQSINDNSSSLSDFDLDPNFSVFLRSPQGSITAHRSSAQLELHSRSPDQSTSISPVRLTDGRNTHYEDIELNMDSGNTSAVGQVCGPVKEEDLSTQSIASLLVLLRSLIFPRFDTASQKYEYGNSVLSDLFGPQRCEWLCFEYEELLESYLERSLETIRKRRSARIYGTFSSEPNLHVCGSKEGSVCSDEITMRFNPTGATIAPKLRNTFSHSCETPMGVVLFRVREVPGDTSEEEGIGSESLIRISFMPRASKRTTGLCVQLFGQIGGPAIIREINTFNVIPYGSGISFYNKDLKGVQTLFDLGVADARDVNPGGQTNLAVGTDAIRRSDSLCLLKLQDAMLCGVPDIFRLLLRSGASAYVCEDSRRPTDIITAIWKTFAEANSGELCFLEAILKENLRSVKQCVAMTQIALEYDCTIDSADSANDSTLAATPLFDIVGKPMEEADPVDAIDYLFSIGWDFEEQNYRGQTPLLYAAYQCFSPAARCLRTLIGKGARLDAKCSGGRGPLHWA